MQLLICGSRGSVPVSGREFVRYGGNTSCIAISRGGGVPSLVLDAGTGIRRLSRELDGGPFLGTILLSHLHWDHTQGLAFFGAAEHPDSEVTVAMPAQGDPEELLGRALGPPFFPLRPAELRGRWRFVALEPGNHTIDGFSVTAQEIPHPGGRTFGYRVSDGDATLAYLSDHSPTTFGPGPDGLGEYHSSAMQLASGVDLLVHDSQHLAAELPAKEFLGHSAVEYAIGLAEKAGARRLVLFHHDPERTDEQVDDIVTGAERAPVAVVAAAEGQTISVE